MTTTTMTPPSTSLPSSATATDNNRLFIIGAGLSRTGTETMTAAMEILLGLPAYHCGKAVVVKGMLKEGGLWKRPEGVPDFERIFDRRDDGVVYSSCFDTPGYHYVAELMARYPNYRVVLTKRRSAEEWADSVMNTVVPMANRLRFLDRITCGRVRPIRRAVEFVDEYSLGKPLGFTSLNSTPEKLVKVYNLHLEKIRKLVPADRLIECSVADGWEPLCQGLGVAIPSVPFPRKNERAGFKMRTHMMASATFWKNHWPQLLCIVAVLFALFYLLMGQFTRMF